MYNERTQRQLLDERSWRFRVFGSLFIVFGAVALFLASIGLLLAFILASSLSFVLCRVNARDPVVFAAIAALLAVVGLVACLIPARRATRVDPLVALRYD